MTTLFGPERHEAPAGDAWTETAARAVIERWASAANQAFVPDQGWLPDPRDTTAQRLYDTVQSNLHNTAREPQWGSPGSRPATAIRDGDFVNWWPSVPRHQADRTRRRSARPGPPRTVVGRPWGWPA